MKIKLEIELEVPDVENMTAEQLSQVMWDGYVNYVTRRHAEDALKWCARMSRETSAAAIYKHHDTWTDIAASAVWRIAPDASDLVYRLRKRAEIRRQIPTRKSVQNGEADRLADLLDEAANMIDFTQS